jgi:hypothetical protein
MSGQKLAQAAYVADSVGTLGRLRRRLLDAVRWYDLTREARRAAARDKLGLPEFDPGIERATSAAVDWLCVAQDRSASADGGVARAYSLVDGWTSSYPETTGYIVPTFLDYARRTGDTKVRDRARRMLDWLVDIQMPSGAFQGGRIDSKPVVPVVFNTGQILIGLASGEAEWGGFRQPLRRAADWLVDVQDADGCWRRHSSPFAGSGDKTYDTHTAWGLLEAARIEPGRGYAEAGIANVRWALRHQHANGWMANCCLSNFSQPLTHTLGYALRGIVEAYLYTRDPALLADSRRTADGLLGAMRNDGFLPGKLRPDWSSDEKWAGLAGTAQIAICWLLLYRETGELAYLDAARAANRYVRRTMEMTGASDVVGGVKGSFPVDGAYCRYEYPNWAAKFLVDSLLLEAQLGDGMNAVRRQGALVE